MTADERHEGSRRWRNPLIAHDGQIAAHHLRAIFSNLGDGLTVIVGAIFFAGLARYGLFSVQQRYRPVVVSVVASVIALYLHHLLARRIVFFQQNSVIADAAHDVANLRGYCLCVATISCLALTVMPLFPDIILVSVSLGTFCTTMAVAALLSALVGRLRHQLPARAYARLDRLLASRHIGRGLSVAAMGGAAGVFAASRLLDPSSAGPLAGILSLALGIWFAPVAHAAVDYERLIGHSPIASLATRLRGGLLLAVACSGGALLGLRWRVAVVVAVVFALLLLYKVAEILVARAIGGDRAQVAMVLLLFSLASIAVVAPLLLPLLVSAGAWWLLAKGSRRTWQLP